MDCLTSYSFTSRIFLCNREELFWISDLFMSHAGTQFFFQSTLKTVPCPIFKIRTESILQNGNTPADFATLSCIWPNSSLPIFLQVTDSDKYRCVIYKSIFFNNWVLEQDNLKQVWDISAFAHFLYFTSRTRRNVFSSAAL